MTDLAARCVEEFGEAEERSQIIRIASALNGRSRSARKNFREARPP